MEALSCKKAISSTSIRELLFMSTSHYPVIIIGGAAVGSAAAYFLQSNPDFSGQVLVIEKDLSYQYCATTLSAASIRHQFTTPENIEMSLFGTQFLRDFQKNMEVNGDCPDPAFHEGGYLFLASTTEGKAILEENHALQNQLGAQIVLLSPSDISQRYPWMYTSDLEAGSLGIRGEGWLDAYGMMQGMRRKAVTLGAKYIQDEVISIEKKGAYVTSVTLKSGAQYSCDALINAAGTSAAALAKQVGINLPVESKKRCIFYFQCPEKLENCPMVIDPSGAYFRPEGDGYIAGISPPADQDPTCLDFNVQHHLFEEILWPILAERVPAFEALRLVRSWAGHYDMNQLDQNVIIGSHPTVSNFYFANGFSGHGMQQAPAVGRALSELIIYGKYQSLDLSRLGWARVLNHQPIIESNVV